MNTSDELNASAVRSGNSLSVGTTLREAREKAGLSVADIASRIKFAPRQIEALEADAFLHLPEPAFVRGFVRSYARLLHLDENILLEALPSNKPQTSLPQAEAPVEVPMPVRKSLTLINIKWLTGAVAIALVIVLFVLLRGHDEVKSAAVVTEPSVQAPEQAIPAVETAAVQQPAQSSDTAKLEITEQPVVAEKKSEQVGNSKTENPVEVKMAEIPTEQDAVAKANVSAEEAVVSPPATVDKTALSLEKLKLRPIHFVFEEDAWVEVKDANGVLLLSKINRRGSEQWVGGPKRAPYAVSISPPNNVKLYYKGKEVDLAEYAAKEVARLKVE
jgi:cytoskeleton protein RodZ